MISIKLISDQSLFSFKTLFIRVLHSNTCRNPPDNAQADQVNSAAASILENTQVIYSLNNEKGYDALAKRLNLSAHDLNQLRSIKNKFSGHTNILKCLSKSEKRTTSSG